MKGNWPDLLAQVMRSSTQGSAQHVYDHHDDDYEYDEFHHQTGSRLQVRSRKPNEIRKRFAEHYRDVDIGTDAQQRILSLEGDQNSLLAFFFFEELFRRWEGQEQRT